MCQFEVCSVWTIIYEHERCIQSNNAASTSYYLDNVTIT